MKRFKAKFKREKCKYKRCTYRRTHPVDNPRYCAKYVDIATGSAPKFADEVGKVTRVDMLGRTYTEPSNIGKRSLAKHLKSLIFR